MCGINLIIDKKKRLGPHPITQMNKALEHRGPDNEAFLEIEFKEFRIFLGATRLKINDLSNIANQPFQSKDKIHCIAFNGEIYNHKKLKHDYLADQIFTTHSDTEVLLKYLVKNRGKNLHLLNGIFAFVFIDSESEEIIISRDNYGVKPLYSYEDENFYIVSSEIKGIIASGQVKKELNELEVINYCCYRFASKPSTLYKNIFEFEAGKIFVWNGNGKEYTNIIKNSFLQLDSSLILENPVKFFNERIRQAILQQIPGEVPFGLMLSGGIDSTLILAILNEAGIKKTPSFTIVTDQPDKNYSTQDSYFAELASKLFSTEYFPVPISSSTINTFEEYLETIDQPIADTAGWLSWLICKKAKNNCKVLLSGAGADEIFLGYNRHNAFSNYLSFPKNIIPLINKLSLFPEGPDIRFRKNFRLINKYLNSISKSPAKTWENFVSLSGFDDDFFHSGSKKTAIDFTQKDLLSEAVNWDIENYLMQDVLKVTDNASMSQGVEVRVPFLDMTITGSISSLDKKFLLRNGKKWILKGLLKNKDGEEFISRPKEGFGMPVGKWLKDKQGFELTKYIKNKKNIIYNFIKYDKVHEMLFKHENNKRDFSAELYGLILLAAWVEKEFD